LGLPGFFCPGGNQETMTLLTARRIDMGMGAA
jgi:hypothetical protein